jgi:hypothetical protein
MNEPNLEEKLNELVREFGGLDSLQHKKLVTLAEEAKKSRERLARSVSFMQESLDYLRICIKYQAFDLEATRRENRYLRKLLEEKQDDEDLESENN